MNDDRYAPGERGITPSRGLARTPPTSSSSVYRPSTIDC
jgi:hypothetical protein